VTASLQRAAIADLIAKAESLGVPVPAAVHGIACTLDSNHGAITYANAHPEDDAGRPTGDVPDAMLGCCLGSAMHGLRGCTCWTATYDTEQADPQPITGPGDLQPRDRQCGDCAFRRDSPERAEPWTAETLLALPGRGEPFWCHDGMRRPSVWRHPSGATVPGNPDDWQPARVGAVPYRADGRPALLCHGWAVRAAGASHGD
jgi:hypothetical protein